MNLEIVEAKGQRVLTTKQIAEAYGTTKDKVIYNFNYNKSKYILGKHYIEVSGAELKELKRTCENQISFKYAKNLYLWTEKGALLHAKSLNTDKAWEVYDWLVDFYFRVKEQHAASIKPVQSRPMVLDIPGNKSMQKKLSGIDDNCIAIKSLLTLYNRCISQEHADSYRTTLEALASEIFMEAFDLKNVKIKMIPQP